MDNDIIDSTLYTYKVRAFKDGIFSGYSNEIDVLSLLRPIDGPMGVNASPLDSARIQINWLNPSNSYGTIVIERKDLINGTFSRLIQFHKGQIILLTIICCLQQHIIIDCILLPKPCF